MYVIEVVDAIKKCYVMAHNRKALELGLTVHRYTKFGMDRKD